jgi:hypothetical protein
MKIAGSGAGVGPESESVSQRNGSADPDPYQNVMIRNTAYDNTGSKRHTKR